MLKQRSTWHGTRLYVSLTVVEDRMRFGNVNQTSLLPLHSPFAIFVIQNNNSHAANQYFYGIIILMNFADHAPAHFHAWYNEYKVIVSIKDGIVKGEMPGRALKMILEWLEQHKEELMENREKAQNGDPLEKIEPLK